MFEFQSKWIAGVLSGRIALPLQEEMMEDIEDFYRSLEASNFPKRYTHYMGDSQASLIPIFCVGLIGSLYWLYSTFFIINVHLS